MKWISVILMLLFGIIALQYQQVFFTWRAFTTFIFDGRAKEIVIVDKETFYKKFKDNTFGPINQTPRPPIAHKDSNLIPFPFTSLHGYMVVAFDHADGDLFFDDHEFVITLNKSE